MITQAKMFAERVVLAFVWQFFAVMVAGGVADLYHGQTWLKAVDTGGWAALLAVGTSLVTVLTPLAAHLTGVADAIVRATLQFVQSFFGSVVAGAVSPSILHVNWFGALAVGLVAAAPAFLKALAALGLPTTLGASLVRPHSRTVDV